MICPGYAPCRLLLILSIIFSYSQTASETPLRVFVDIRRAQEHFCMHLSAMGQPMHLEGMVGIILLILSS
jgi:hypothetical protein